MKKLSKENKILLLSVAVAAVLGGGYYFYKKNQDKKQEALASNTLEQGGNTNEQAPAGNTQATIPTPAPAVVINTKKKLKKGSKGTEVKILQEKLGIKADGVFGPQTQAALLDQRGVYSISLFGFDATKSPNVAPQKKKDNIQEAEIIEPKQVKKILRFKKGSKVMAIKNPTIAYQTKKTAAGGLYNTGIKQRTFGYGDHVGNFLKDPFTGAIYAENNGLVYALKKSDVKPY